MQNLIKKTVCVILCLTTISSFSSHGMDTEEGHLGRRGSTLITVRPMLALDPGETHVAESGSSSVTHTARTEHEPEVNANQRPPYRNIIRGTIILAAACIGALVTALHIGKDGCPFAHSFSDDDGKAGR